MANSFPGSGLAYADAFSVGTANSFNSSLSVCSSCVQATRIEHVYNQTGLHHNTLWLRANNSGANLAASIGFTVVNDGGDHHRANIAATANSGLIGGNLALYTRNNSGADNLGIYIDHAGNTGIGTSSPGNLLHVNGTSQFNDTMNITYGRMSWGGSTARFIVTSCGGYNLAFGTDNFTDRMTIQSSTGNIGIATDTPNVCTRVQINVAGSGCYGLMINKTDANESTIRFKSTHGCGSDYRIGASINVDSAFEVTQQENNCSRFVIRCTGNVGIGTYTPRYSLDVAGGAMSNFYMSCCAATIDGIGPYDYGIIGSGNGAGSLLINDIVGARYSISGGSYNLTFRKSVRGTSTACAYCTVMTFLGTTDTNCDVHVNIANRLGLGTSPSYKLDIAGTSGAIASMRIAAIYCGGGLGLVHLTSSGTEGGTITYEKTSGTTQKYKMGLAGDNCFFIYNETAGNQPFTLTPAGNFGFNTTSPSYRLHVNGTFYAAGSSIDYKQGICKYDTDSCMFMKLKPVTYQYKEEFKHLGKELKSQTQIGLIAEEVAEVAPELAILVKENDNDVVRNVDYEKLTIVLLSEVQKLRKELDDLKTK